MLRLLEGVAPCCIQPAVSLHSATESARWLYIQVIQRHQVCGGAVIPVAAQGLFVQGIHWLVFQGDAYLSVHWDHLNTLYYSPNGSHIL